MSSNHGPETVVSLTSASKCYQIYPKPHHRLLQMFMRGRRRYYREFWALRDLSLEIKQGEVVGIIGSNGAGKSTLLQLVCGTLAPSHGTVEVKGRIAALLELGAGFNPEFTGRENIYLSATIAGMTSREIDAAFDSIVTFAGIGEFIDQPVKTYSSGMYVRLAFSVAINVDPDILVIDEALSVGDGEFSRKSFDRIMKMKEAGKTILFCSHAMYQIDALCDRVVWLDRGNAEMIGDAAPVTSAYSRFLEGKGTLSPPVPVSESGEADKSHDAHHKNLYKITLVRVQTGSSVPATELKVKSRSDNVKIIVEYTYPGHEQLPPGVGIALTDANERVITSFIKQAHAAPACPENATQHRIGLDIEKFPFLKGIYHVYVFLLCERGIHVYDYAHAVASIHVEQDDILQGIVSVPHKWSAD